MKGRDLSKWAWLRRADSRVSERQGYEELRKCNLKARHHVSRRLFSREKRVACQREWPSKIAAPFIFRLCCCASVGWKEAFGFVVRCLAE